MANEKNLKPFKKGQSGNPDGRPLGSKSFKVILNKVLDGVMTIQEAGEAKNMTKREVIAMELGIIALDRKAKKHDRLKAIDMIMDRLDGKPKQTVDTTVTERYQMPKGLSKKQLLKLAGIDAKQ